jgi:hypothetical protein
MMGGCRRLIEDETMWRSHIRTPPTPLDGLLGRDFVKNISRWAFWGEFFRVGARSLEKKNFYGNFLSILQNNYFLIMALNVLCSFLGGRYLRVFCRDVSSVT